MAPTSDRELLRRTFDDVAEAYDRARPTYPTSVYDDLAALGGLRHGDRVVEIGPGTGKATVELAERGYAVTGVDLGARLAAVARRNLAAYPDVEIVVAPFESWAPERAGFDAVVAFCSFHWIDPDVRYERAARLLRAGGHLGVLEVKHVVPDDADPFFREVQADYDELGVDDGRRPLRPQDVPDLAGELEASPWFDVVAVRRHTWHLTYDAAAYVDVIDTHSRHRALDPDVREELYARIRRRIEARPGGTVRSTYLGTLNLGRRAERAA